MKFDNIERLFSIFDKSTLLEFRYVDDDVELYLSRKGEGGQVSDVVPAAPIAMPVEEEQDDSESYITSPIVSTFYPAPSPGAKPFVAVGDKVAIGQTVCILEAMKIMTEVKCEFECEIESVLVSSGQKVEYGQPLFRVKRS
jgi:acetyl-CoA carboxylase biotin carboxyl carrier protein